MKRRKWNRTAVGFVLLLVLFVVLLLGNSLRRTAHIVLPSADAAVTPDGELSEEQTALHLVEIRPDTVQSAIATLERPTLYRRTLTVQQFWSGGSGTQEETVTAAGGWTRVDRTLAAGQVRHIVTNGENTYLWYNRQTAVQTVPTNGITADMEQHSPTYEDVLELPTDQITQADYRTVNGVNCIYVETAADEAGYVLCYWVSVETGLLVAAEKQQNGETVYRLWQTEQDLEPEVDEDFVLPDGTDVLRTA